MLAVLLATCEVNNENVLTKNYDMTWDYKWEPTKLQSEVSLLGVDALLGILSQLRLQMLLMRNFPAIFKSGCRVSAQFGNVSAFASIYCFYLFSFNDYILK